MDITNYIVEVLEAENLGSLADKFLGKSSRITVDLFKKMYGIFIIQLLQCFFFLCVGLVCD